MPRHLSIALTCLFATIAFPGCSSISAEINGENARIVTRTYSNLPSDFQAISASAAFDVDYTVSPKVAATVSCSENVANHLVVEVRNGCLYLGIKESISLNNVTIKATVTGPALTAISASSASKIEILSPMSIKGATLSLKASSAAGIELEAPATYAEIKASASSASSISLNGATATDVILHSSSASSVDLKDIKAVNISANASSASGIDITGTASKVSYEASSGASIDAKRLSAQSGKADASSGGSIDSNVKSLDYSSSSGGSVDNR
ncbi:MAG: DUF2807 domain-containing protein [Alloprevotella sp.]|nr:DUF2807 domain-containing protein [Alloprevotella sp.]